MKVWISKLTLRYVTYLTRGFGEEALRNGNTKTL